MTHQPRWLSDWLHEEAGCHNLRQLVRGHLRGRARVHLAGAREMCRAVCDQCCLVAYLLELTHCSTLAARPCPACCCVHYLRACLATRTHVGLCLLACPGLNCAHMFNCKSCQHWTLSFLTQ